MIEAQVKVTENHKIEINKALLTKYNSNGPRYTSYPTALEMQNNSLSTAAISHVISHSENKELSLYVHIPFCQQLCYYCGCHKYLARNQDKAEHYIKHLLKEIDAWYALCEGYQVSQIHFGGGTPTFVENKQLFRLVALIKTKFNIASHCEVSIEVDPRTCDAKRLSDLIDYGFNRFSFGIQDFNPKTQIAINRQQSVDMIAPLVDVLKSNKNVSFNFDLIYGLPYQTEALFAETIKQVIEFKPHRISVFNYAHMPERFAEQKKIATSALPDSAVKLAMQLNTIEQLTLAGYIYLGIDHYALPNDALALEQAKGKLHRNFQGYTTHRQCDLIGLGVSAISQIGDVMLQNEKQLSEYQRLINNADNAVVKTIKKKAADLKRGYIIKELLCNLKVNFKEYEEIYQENFITNYEKELKLLIPYIEDDLITVDNNSIEITRLGRLFTRLICKAFDQYSQDKNKQFSKVL